MVLLAPAALKASLYRISASFVMISTMEALSAVLAVNKLTTSFNALNAPIFISSILMETAENVRIKS